ncbi:hypothetical protein BGW38_001157 [Lunasporangiospora selenospora]|uniref:mRNA export factor GLE1 n=1 Tax=Lunasporangiospora selenospora TaxID=979761 RepID=A0A9P6KEA6_9FUNG|nr:hypothetical protein BGW38_001157 [Lunasporangiospora selenospora]
MKKEIDDCLAKVKEERETAIRIREEAARAVQLEKERLEKEVEDKKKAEEAAKVAREEIAKANAQAVATASAAKAKQQAAAAAQHQASTTSTVFASDSANREYDHYISVLNHLKQNVDPAVSNDPATKKYCFAQRREIRAIIGQLVNIKKEIFRVATELDSMFKETMRTRGAAAYYWVMNTTAKKLVKQAETEALVTASHTFPLAHVAVLLFTNHEKFKDVLMARFSKKCPYVIPKYFAKEPTETPDQFLKKLGYTMKEKGWESEAQYDARQCGMFSLYCAIMQTTPQVGQNLYPLSQGWTWMARIINMPPHPITPALITVFLEVCGHGYMRAYRQQANKVLQLLMSDFIPLIPKEGVAGTTRLKTLLENLLKTGQIPVPEGREFDG